MAKEGGEIPEQQSEKRDKSKIIKRKKRKTADTWKKKEWYTIMSPKCFEERDIGDTPADDESKIMDRQINVPLRDITGKMGHQFVKIMLKPESIKGKTIYTRVVGLEITPEQLRRNIRRRRSIAKCVVDVVSKDGKKIRTTGYGFTAMKVDTTRKDQVRAAIRRGIEAEGSANTFEAFIQKCAYGIVPTEMLKTVKKICPVKRIEISKCVLLENK
ncbi:MAG: hypothetical protein V1911_04030 [Candidatus Micrarchaeota archaeon]